MLNQKLQKIILVIFTIIFFSVSSWFIITSPNIFNSPDETANNFFIHKFALQGDFLVFEPLNNFLENQVRPRSISFNGVSLVPQGFIGLPLIYGFLAKIIGINIIYFLTPLFAVLGVLAFYGAIKKIWDDNIAFISSILLFSFPIFLYYSARSLYPNVPFVSMLLIAFWSLVNNAFTKTGKIRYLVIFTISLGMALAFRPVEFLWIAPIFFINLFIYRKVIDFKKIIYFIILICFISLPFLYNNLVLYGGLFATGYTLSGPVITTTNATLGIDGAIQKSILLLYGFHPRVIFNNFINIIIKYFWWYMLPAIFGFFIWLKEKKEKQQIVFVLSSLLISLWLLFFYGSGVFVDNPNIGRLTIGDSHFRYWLPIFILILPFVAICLRFIIKYLAILRYKKILLFIFLSFIFSLSIYSTFFSLDDGLYYVRENLKNNYFAKAEILKYTDDEDIIITTRQDKIIFPSRAVLYLEDIKNLDMLKLLHNVNNRNFYYFTIGIKNDEFNNINNILASQGFKLERVLIIGKEVLYKLNEIFI